jgi:hypothetical protein
MLSCVLGPLGRSDDGLSLEEVLSAMGLGCGLPPQFTKAFREQWTRCGEEERIRGIGLRADDA